MVMHLEIVYVFYLLNQLDTSGQIKTEVDEDPDDTLTLVLLLLQDEHVMVEELLQLLVHEVDPQLLERVELQRLIL